MKKYLVFIAIASLLFSACAKEEVESLKNPASYEFTLKASVDSELTKTSYADDKYFSWSAGDQISVLFHNGSDNKFFTLTTSDTGVNASFSGIIEGGYELGSSNDEKIALFPASDHSYDRTKAKYSEEDYPKRGPFFNIPALTDFTKTHVSANLPMAAIGDGDDNFAFKHIAGAYKLVFKDIDPSVTKVKLHVKNQIGRALSGDFRLEDGGSHNYVWWWGYAAEGSEAQTVSYIANVVSGKATFYIPYCHNDESGFQPIFTLSNVANGNTLKTLTAKAPFSGDMKPSYRHLVVLPEIPASGTGTAPAWKSNYGINWDMVDTSVGGRTSENLAGVNLMKVTSDAVNVYLLLDLKSSYLLDDDSYDYSNYFHLYVGDGSDSGSSTWMWNTKYQHYWAGWLKTANETVFTAVDGSFSGAVAATSGDHCYYEIAIPRAGNDALMGSTAYFGCVFNKRYYEGGEVHDDPTMADTWVGYAPAPWNPMFEVTLATAALELNLSFTEADNEVPNPERGMMSYNKFNIESAGPYSQVGINLDYPGESLAFLLFYLTYYMDKDLDSEIVDYIEAELDKVRAANKKAVLRFAYCEDKSTTDPLEATPEQILAHIDQLTPTFENYSDIIYVLQAGWLGTYGEWYYKTNNHGNYVAEYTDYYKFTVSGTTVSDYNNNHTELLDNLLFAVPSPIHIALRRPAYKRYYLSPSNIDSWDEITSWGTDENSRISFFNDGFRGDAGDVGTFVDDQDRPMWYSQSNWLVCGGELSYKSPESFALVSDDLKDCDNSIDELKRQHWSYLHYSTSNQFMQAWYEAGRFDDIKKALGYRLVLDSADIIFTGLSSGSTVNYSFAIENTGGAPVIYPRPFQLVLLHNGSDPLVLKDNLMDVRNIAPGAAQTEISGSFTLPRNMSAGDQIAIWLPDNAVELRSTPAYSIRLANSDIAWTNGYNVLYTL